MTEKNDKRFLTTDRKIQDYFIDLLYKKSFNNITVTDIVKAANISRGTFYLHYNDKYDLLEFIENTIMSELKEVMNSPKINPSNKPYSELVINKIEENFRYFKKKSKLLKAVIINNSNANFEYKFKRHIEQIFRDKKSLPSESDNIAGLHYSFIYISAAYFDVMKDWIKTGMKEEEKDMAKLFFYMTRTGPINVVKNIIDKNA